ncbi:hypothetical protein K2X83_02700, partial [Patescibacteria group bacterium]|nr:hypothetical protein [Patescibacteria group bacterium]
YPKVYPPFCPRFGIVPVRMPGEEGIVSLDDFRKKGPQESSYSFTDDGGITFQKEKPEKSRPEVFQFAQTVVSRITQSEVPFPKDSEEQESFARQQAIARHDATTTEMLHLVMEREMKSPGHYTSRAFLLAAAREFVRRFSAGSTTTS